MSQSPDPRGEALSVSDVPERARYEARVGEDGPLAAVLTYERSGEHITLQHTQVREEYEGQGIGSRLVADVFADLRERGLRVIPRCPFVVAWLKRHPEEHDLLVDAG